RGQGADSGWNAGQGQGRTGYTVGTDPPRAGQRCEDEEGHRRSAGDGRDRGAEESVQGGQGGGRGIQIRDRGGGSTSRLAGQSQGPWRWGITLHLSSGAAVYVISVAADLAGMHPQTLRQYDRLGLVTPERTAGRGRRYSGKDIAKLRLIQQLSQDE